MIGTLTKRHDLPMVTSTAILTYIGWVHSNVLAPSFFRFGSKFVEELRPRGIMNAFCQTMIMGHAVDAQVLYRNDTETVYDLPAFPMGEIIPSELDALMHAGNGLAMLPPFGGSLSEFAVLALYLCQRLFFLTKKAGIGNLTTIRQGRKRLESYINPDLLWLFRKSLRVTLHRERGIPFAGTAFLDGEGFDLSSDGAVQDDLHVSNTGKRKLPLSIDLEPELRVGEAVIAALAL
jgi:hypothetical protein